jgi:uncharacterized protein (DUF1778 family)
VLLLLITPPAPRFRGNVTVKQPPCDRCSGAYVSSARNLRIDPETDARIRRAAATAGVSVSVFVASAAGAAADDVLADRREFVLEPERWEEFVRMLDRPACELPKLLDAGKRREQLLSE